MMGCQPVEMWRWQVRNLGAGAAGKHGENMLITG